MEKLHKRKFIFALMILVVLLVTVAVISIFKGEDKKDTVDKNVNIEIEKDDNKEDDVAGLDVIEENDGTKEDRTDASGSWEDGNMDKDTSSTKEPVGNHEDKEQSDNEIFSDEKSWGEIY